MAGHLAWRRHIARNGRVSIYCYVYYSWKEARRTRTKGCYLGKVDRVVLSYAAERQQFLQSAIAKAEAFRDTERVPIDPLGLGAEIQRWIENKGAKALADTELAASDSG